MAGYDRLLVGSLECVDGIYCSEMQCPDSKVEAWGASGVDTLLSFASLLLNTDEQHHA